MLGSKPVDSRAVDSQTVEPGLEELLWPVLPTETEIYLLPDGRVVIADMPVELNDLVTVLGGRVDDE